MQRNNEEAALENLNRHLQSMEKMLQKADEYNDTLADRINKLKDILGSNQKLFITVNLFNDYKCRVKNNSYTEDDDVESKLCNQLNMLGSNLISVGNQLKLMRKDKTDRERSAKSLHHWSYNGSNPTNKCWTQCKTQMQDMLQMSQLTLLQRPTDPFLFQSDIKETPIRQIRCHKKIIQRVESILAKAEHFNIRSETLTNVKVLAKMILNTLVKPNHLHPHQFRCLEGTMSNKLPDSLDYNPYL
ncbi:hypothetical protein ACLKA7_008546 [Drosophila subpalustris]